MAMTDIVRWLVIALSLVLFIPLRERLALCDVPHPFKGLPITLITLGLVLLALSGLSGMI